MNASGIAVADTLRQTWATLAPSVRFLLLAIRNESIVLDATADAEHDLATDLTILQTMLHDDIPAYVIARIDNTQFLAISYVPDSASVRDKMLYASSRTALTKQFGAASFTDSLFATSKSDLSPAAYAAHLRSAAAPKPLSVAEKERAAVHAAERAASSAPPRQTPLASAHLHLSWSDDAERAVASLASVQTSTLAVLGVDPATESLILLADAAPTVPNVIGSALPTTQPSYAFFAWSHSNRSDIIFIYSCPSSSTVKLRMIFSACVQFVCLGATSILGAPVFKKLETSDPQEVDESFLRTALDTVTSSGSSTTNTEPRPFARPRGPARAR